MVTGILALRYAKAFYAYAAERGEENFVYDDMKHLSHQFIVFPTLRKYLANPVLKNQNKIELLKTACDSPCGSTLHFFDFLTSKEKLDSLLYIAMNYLTVYRKNKKIIHTVFESAAEPEPGVTEKIRNIVRRGYPDDYVVELETIILPELIGGFRIRSGDLFMDASAKGELENIRKKLTSAK